MSNKRKLVIPSDEEDALIKAGIATDQDTHELSDIELKQLRTMRGRPLGSGKKVQLTIRFDADVILAFKQAGDGWQTKMNDALREWLTAHPAM